MAHLVRTSELDAGRATRVISDVLAFLGELPEEFASRRHHELQGEGLSNNDIFARIAAELVQWRFRAPAYSERQIRRMIYG